MPFSSSTILGHHPKITSYVLFLFFFFGCDNSGQQQIGVNRQSKAKKPEANKPDDYFECKNDICKVLKSVNAPVFLWGDPLQPYEIPIHDLSKENAEQLKYALIPEAHWFVQLTTANPFNTVSELGHPRSVIWNYQLNHRTTQKRTALFKRDSYIIDASIDSVGRRLIERLFGPEYEWQSLGHGSFGTVYAVRYDQQQYALKRGASDEEINNLERLQFTGAVIPIYAWFSLEGSKYLVMQKGRDDLATLTKSRIQLNESQVQAAVKTFTRLVHVKNAIAIKITDVKPENIVVTNDDSLRLIDVDSGYTPGYNGNTAKLLARALLSNQLLRPLIMGDPSLSEYFQYEYLRYKIASPFLLKYWFRMICKEHATVPASCENATQFAEVFDEFRQEQIYKMAQKTNEEFNDKSGTRDIRWDTNQYPNSFHTQKPLPFVFSSSELNWQEFFDAKEEISSVS